jgi:hypothetical protein
MSKYLNGITHAVVTIPEESDANQSCVVAIVDIYFGQDTAICGMKYSKRGGNVGWRAPMVQFLKDGKEWIPIPVFKGGLLLDICKLCSQAISRVKKTFGRPVWGHKYIVLRDRVIHQDREGKEIVDA